MISKSFLQKLGFKPSELNPGLWEKHFKYGVGVAHVNPLSHHLTHSDTEVDYVFENVREIDLFNFYINLASLAKIAQLDEELVATKTALTDFKSKNLIS